MSNELEEFLARILQVNVEKKQPSKLPPRPVAPHPHRRSPSGGTEVDDLEVISAEAVSEQSMAPTHLRSTTDLSSRDISEHAEHLGHTFGSPKKSHVGDEVKSHLDHKVGRLTSTAFDPAPLPDDEPVDIAAQIAKMLQTSAGLRQAVIMQEVLQRPEYRW